MQWTNEPPSWRHDGDDLVVRSAGQTDFWRITHDGGIRDHGHFYHDQFCGDFNAQVFLSGCYRDQYDQAGLMIRVDPLNWLKCGIELIDGVQYASAVVTRQFSDWSVVRLANPSSFYLEVHRRGQTFEVLYSLDREQVQLIRQAYLPAGDSVAVGPMIASPTGPGFEATFRSFGVKPTLNGSEKLQ